jgi:hypothetical protein
MRTSRPCVRTRRPTGGEGAGLRQSPLAFALGVAALLLIAMGVTAWGLSASGDSGGLAPIPIPALRGIRFGDSQRTVDARINPMAPRHCWSMRYLNGALRVVYVTHTRGAAPRAIGDVLGLRVMLGGTSKGDLVAALGPPDQQDRSILAWVKGGNWVGFQFEGAVLFKVSAVEFAGN